VGIIDAPSSGDYFTFSTTGGAASFTVTTAAVGPTLHARLELWSAFGLVATGGSATALGASLYANLAAGKYYIVVRSYGGYGDVGQYALSALVPQGKVVAANSAFTVPATFTLTSDQALYAQDASGNWRLLSPAGTILSISASTDSAGQAEVFALATDHSLWVFRRTTGWLMLSPAGTINALSASTSDVVFALASDHSLWINNHNVWAILSPAGTINALAASPGDVVFALASDASLWLHGAAGWAELSPAGTILSVSAGASANGSPEAFVMASNDTYWTYTQSGWALSTASAAPVAAALVTQKQTSPQQAPLLQAAVNSQETAGANHAANPLFPHEPLMPLCMCPWCVAARLAAQRH
jgi:hypothetical protein